MGPTIRTLYSPLGTSSDHFRVKNIEDLECMICNESVKEKIKDKANDFFGHMHEESNGSKTPHLICKDCNITVLKTTPTLINDLKKCFLCNVRPNDWPNAYDIRPNSEDLESQEFVITPAPTPIETLPVVRMGPPNIRAEQYERMALRINSIFLLSLAGITFYSSNEFYPKIYGGIFALNSLASLGCSFLHNPEATERLTLLTLFTILGTVTVVTMQGCHNGQNPCPASTSHGD